MDAEEVKKIIAHISAGYARRFLDEKVYDRLLASTAGQQLLQLSPAHKNTLEFIALTMTAFAMERKGSATAVRTFTDSIVSDVTPGLFKRIHAGAPDFNADDLKIAMNLLTDEDIDPGTKTSASGTQSYPETSPNLDAEIQEFREWVQSAQKQIRTAGQERRAKRAEKFRIFGRKKK